MPSLDIHRVEKISSRIKKLDSNTFVLTITVQYDNDNVEIDIFSDKPENLSIINESI